MSKCRNASISKGTLEWRAFRISTSQTPFEIVTAFPTEAIQFQPLYSATLAGVRIRHWKYLCSAFKEKSKEDAGGWKDYERPIDRLAELMTKEERRTDIAATGNGWWLEIGPVDLNETIVTIQRNNELVAALSRRSDGRLRVSAFRALDAKSVAYLASLGQIPHPEHGVSMRENNWEYALDSAATMGNHYAAEAGDAYLSFWEKGIGISSDGTDVEAFRIHKDLVARQPEWVAVELAVHDLYRS